MSFSASSSQSPVSRAGGHRSRAPAHITENQGHKKCTPKRGAYTEQIVRCRQKTNEQLTWPYRNYRAPGRPSCVLPSHGLHRSTLGDGALNFRVRNGTGCGRPSLAAGPSGDPACGEPPWRSHSAQTVLQISSPATRPRGGIARRARPISTARLSASRRLQLRPINLVVYEGPYRKED